MLITTAIEWAETDNLLSNMGYFCENLNESKGFFQKCYIHKLPSKTSKVWKHILNGSEDTEASIK